MTLFFKEHLPTACERSKGSAASGDGTCVGAVVDPLSCACELMHRLLTLCASGDASLPPCWKYIWWDITCSQGPTQGLRIFVGQVSPMGEGCGLSVNTVTWIHGDRFGRHSHWHSFTGSVHSVAPSNALAGLYGSHGRGRPLHWSRSYNGTCEIWTDAALLSVFHMILLWHFPLRSRLALLSRVTPTEFLYTYTKVLFTYSVLWVPTWTWQTDNVAQTGRNAGQGHLQSDKGS